MLIIIHFPIYTNIVTYLIERYLRKQNITLTMVLTTFSHISNQNMVWHYIILLFLYDIKWVPQLHIGNNIPNH